MDYDLLKSSMFILAVIVVYAAMARGLFKATEQPRWRALEIAERMLVEPGFPEDHRRAMFTSLKEMHSPLMAWKVAGVMLLITIQSPFKKKQEIEASDVQRGIAGELRRDHSRFMNYWMIAVLGNSPAAALLFVMLGLVSAAFSLSISMVAKLVVSHLDRHTPVRPA
ncbi:MAG: hypothetical protein A4S14_02865 [Proteobacteria bacterium SG_bin9]|nr:MAG: hypothetical protein A4S14_02865 [Proteobacteria bacterium SG_bin9]